MVESNKHLFQQRQYNFKKMPNMKVKNCCFKHHDYLPKNWVDDGEEGECNNSIGEKLQNCEKQKEHIMVVLTNNNKNSKTHVPPNHQLWDFLHVLEALAHQLSYKFKKSNSTNLGKLL